MRLQIKSILKSTVYGGETGIRTLGTLARSTVFETAPFDHSGTSPRLSGVRRLLMPRDACKSVSAS